MKFTEEQLLLQKSARDFAENEIRPRMRDILSTDEFFPRDLYKRMGELGFLGMMIDKQYGGGGANMTEVCIVTEELAKVCPTAALILMCVAPGLVSFQGSEAFRDKYLDGCMNGDLIFSGAMTDPAGHTNIKEWTVLGVLEGDEYVLNGTKLFVSVSQDCDLNYVFGFDQDHHMKIWVVEGDAPGFTHNAHEKKFGFQASGGGTCTYKNVRVSKDMTFDGEGDLSVFYDMLWVQCSSIALGAAEGALDQAVQYAKVRTNNFKPVASIQYQAERIAKFAAELMSARSLIYDATTSFDAGASDLELFAEGRMKCQACKVIIPDMAYSIAKECMKLHGGLGYSDILIYHYLADAAGTMIADQTTEAVAEALARTLGLGTDFE